MSYKRRAVGVAAVAICLVLAAACTGSQVTPTGPAPSLPGTPGHFNDGQESFDYPADWPVRSGGYGAQTEYVLAVLGDGTWQDGCNLSSGVACPDTVSVAPGQILVKVFRWWGGPFVPCQGDTRANATFGDLAVRKVVNNAVITWEIRVPGNEFGQNNNIFVEVHASDPAQLARAEVMVASFRWGPGSIGDGAGCSPSPS